MPQSMYGQTKDGKRTPIRVDKDGNFSIKTPLWQVIFTVALQIEIIVMIVVMVLK